MSGADLTTEWLAVEPPGPAEIETLEKAGIQLDPFRLGCLVGVGRARLCGGGLFDFDEAGALAFITPVRVDPDAGPDTFETVNPAAAVLLGDIVDIVAWHPAAPGHWALRTGAATTLGAVGPQLLMPPPVSVHRDIAGWLRAGCEGLVMLTRDYSEQQSILQRLDCVIAEDDRHAAELRDIATRRWYTPQVLVRRRRLA